MDAEGEVEDADVDAEGVDGAEGADDTPYCVCRKPSHGEMIGCDNDRCEIEWVGPLFLLSFVGSTADCQFHIGCVGIKEAPDTWYCPDCVRKLGLSSSDGSKPGRGAQKGRKR
jgi:chromatin modification-related protein YNG2